MSGRPSRGATIAERLARTAATRYRRLKKESEAQVVRWEWGTSTLHHIEPFYFERGQFSRGRRLAGAPRGARSGAHGHGFDAAGRIVVERQRTEFPGMEDQTFFVHRDDGIEQLHYSYFEHELVNAAWFTTRSGRVIRADYRYAHGSRASQTYVYAGERLVTIKHSHEDGPYTEELEYDELGRLRRIFYKESGQRRTAIYVRPERAETLAALAPMLRERLVESVMERLAAARKWLPEPVYALALCLDMEAYTHVLPPRLALGLASERERFVTEWGDDGPDSIWSPPEWSLCDDRRLAHDDRALATACAMANQDIWQKGRFRAAVRLCHEVADELRQRLLPIRRTEDFVVFVTDIASGDGRSNVERSVPSKLRRRLVAKRWL
jgi:hypothetical protein